MITYIYLFQLNKEYESMIDEIVETSGHIKRSFYDGDHKVYVFDALVTIDAAMLIQNMMSETLINIQAYVSHQLKEDEIESHIHMMKTLILNQLSSMKGYVTDHDILNMYHGMHHDLLKPFILKKYVNQHVMETSILTYLMHNQNMTVAAKELFVHRNTLITRLEKFHEATGFDVKTFYDAYLIYGLLTQKGH
ncbi:MAG: helix-turn-helix domain-containing protein [Acholeplasmataceae bacterium]